MIPKKIHYCWFGRGEKPKLAQKCIASWHKYCPDYEIIEWNEDNFDLDANPYTRWCYDNRKYAFLSDYARLLIIGDYGGFYFDTDVELIRPLDDLLDNEFVISFENGAYVETAVLGAQKGHPFAKLMADFYIDYPFKTKNGKFNATPSTPIWTHFLKKHYGLKLKNETQNLSRIDGVDDSKVTVFQNDYFCPINYTTKEILLTNNTYAIHYFDASWFDKKLKASEKFLRALYKVVRGGIFTIFTRIYANSVGQKIERYLKKRNKN